MKLRAADGRLKIEHSIIEGLRPVLERLLRNTRKTAAASPAPRKEQRFPFPVSGRASASFALLNDNDEIRSIIPGVIRPVRDARGKATIRVTVPTNNGWKAIGLSAGACQELFISTPLTKEELEVLIKAAISEK